LASKYLLKRGKELELTVEFYTSKRRAKMGCAAAAANKGDFVEFQLQPIRDLDLRKATLKPSFLLAVTTKSLKGLTT
jgi:hypothetical protein